MFIFNFFVGCLFFSECYSAEEETLRTIEGSSRQSFYRQIFRSDDSMMKFLQEKIDPIFSILSSGNRAEICEIPDKEFDAFVQTYMVMRIAFKRSFLVIGSFSISKAASTEGAPLLPPQHNIVAHIPLQEMDDMLMQAQFLRCAAVVDSRARMIRELSFFKMGKKRQILGKS